MFSSQQQKCYSFSVFSIIQYSYSDYSGGRELEGEEEGNGSTWSLYVPWAYAPDLAMQNGSALPSAHLGIVHFLVHTLVVHCLVLSLV